MLKTLLLLTTAVALVCFGATDNTNEVAQVESIGIDENTADAFKLLRDADQFTVNLDHRATNVIWQVDESTNKLDMATFLQVDTNWFPIARGTNIPPAKKPGDIGVKEIGEIQTNRYLTIVYFGKTNKFLMGLVGKEEWPSQKRNRLEPKPQPARK
jgi:hypothetical protein